MPRAASQISASPRHPRRERPGVSGSAAWLTRLLASGEVRIVQLFPVASPLRPRQDSNLRSRLRRAVLYPLSYGGQRSGAAWKASKDPDEVRRRGAVVWLCYVLTLEVSVSGQQVEVPAYVGTD